MMLKHRIACLVLAILWFFLFPGSASAHKVMIFAWVDGDMIHTLSKFSGGKRVKSGQVLVYDSKDVLLLEGKTDKNGMSSFKIPKKEALKIVLKASMGHMAVWEIPSGKIAGSEKAADTTANDLHAPLKTSSGVAGIKTQGKVSDSAIAGLERREIEEIIDASLDKKLGIITEMLADSMNCGPGITEIMGGIGYIFGLVGVALYFANRKRND